jgi:hypothetical protein
MDFTKIPFTMENISKRLEDLEVAFEACAGETPARPGAPRRRGSGGKP